MENFGYENSHITGNLPCSKLITAPSFISEFGYRNHGQCDDQTEKQLEELGDKLPADKKPPIEAALAKLKEAHKAQDIAGIDAATEELNKVFQAASEEMYNQSNNAGGAQAGPQDQQQEQANPNQGKADDNVTDVDFEEVK